MPGRICKHEGCGRPVMGRGMCKPHYNAWNRKNPGITVMALNSQALLEAMPATVAKLVEKTGLAYPTVMRYLKRFNVAGAERKAFIGGWEPTKKVGDKWQAIWHAGKGANKRLTKAEKLEHNKAMDRASAARRDPNLKPKRKPAPPASWMAALGPLEPAEIPAPKPRKAKRSTEAPQPASWAGALGV